MAVTVESLAQRCGAALPNKTSEVTHALSVATTLLTEALVGAFREMPEPVRDECILSIGYAVYDRAKSSDGARSGTTMEGQVPVRAPRDPLASVRSILVNYVLGSV